MKTRLSALVLAPVLGLLLGCQSAPKQETVQQMAALSQPEPAPEQSRAAEPDDPASPKAEPQPRPSPELPPATVTRKIIRNATLRFRVSDQAASGKRIKELTTRFNGLIISEEQNRSGDALTVALTIRVPANRVEPFVDSLLRESIYTDTKTITAEDITRQFVDTEARIRSKKATEAKYLDLLKRARNVAEVIEVENELRQMREEIEVQQAELRQMTNDVAMSTVTLTFYEQTELATNPDTPWLSRIGQSFRAGFGFAGDFVVGLFYVLPLLLLGGVPVWLLLRWWRGRRKANP